MSESEYVKWGEGCRMCAFTGEGWRHGTLGGDGWTGEPCPHCVPGGDLYPVEPDDGEDEPAQPCVSSDVDEEDEEDGDGWDDSEKWDFAESVSWF